MKIKGLKIGLAAALAGLLSMPAQAADTVTLRLDWVASTSTSARDADR